MKPIGLIILFWVTCLGCSKDFHSYHDCDIEDSEKVFSLEELHQMNSAKRNALLGKVIVVEGTYALYSEGMFLHGNSDDEIVFALEFSNFPIDSVRMQVLTWENLGRMSGSRILVKGEYDPSLNGHMAHGEAGIRKVCFFGIR